MSPKSIDEQKRIVAENKGLARVAFTLLGLCTPTLAYGFLRPLTVESIFVILIGVILLAGSLFCQHKLYKPLRGQR